jgi:HlyD family secretion protein
MSVRPFEEFNPSPRTAPLAEVAPTRHPVWVRPPSRQTVVLLAAILAVTAVVGSWAWFGYLRPVTVRVAGVSTNVALQVFGLGTVGADVQSNVGFKVAGVLAKVAAAEGDHVKAGQVLAQLDARDIEAQVAEARAGVLQAKAAIDKAQADVVAAQANLADAQAKAGRRQTLMKEGFASVEETQSNVATMQVASANLTVAKTGVGTAQAGLAAAFAQQQFQEATLANYTLRAPYDAWVMARNLNPGAMPVPGQGVFTLADPRTIWVVGYVDERLAGRLRVGQPAEVALRSEPGRRFPGHIARIEIQSDAVNEERLVDVAFETIPPEIHLAEQAEVYITTGILPQAVLVPAAAVTNFADNTGTVWTLEQGHLAQQRVSFGPELLDGQLPIVAGLPQGDQVVVAPPAGARVGRAARAEQTP